MIQLYTLPYCPYCIQTINKLNSLNVPYNNVNVKDHEKKLIRRPTK